MYNLYIFLRFVSIFFCFGYANAAIQLEDVLSLFENCTVKLNNYQNLDLAIRRTPVCFNSDKQLRLEREHKILTKILFRCVAIFYILPNAGDPVVEDKSVEIWMPEERQERHMDTRLRYDILIDTKNEEATTKWFQWYELLFRYLVSSYGLILKTVDDTYAIQHLHQITLQDQIRIVSRLKLASATDRFVAPSADLQEIIRINRQEYLDILIENVNDVMNNWQISWQIMSWSSGPFFGHQGSYYDMASVSSEGLIHRRLAHMALGGNITIEPLLAYTSTPIIRYSVPEWQGGWLMRDEGPRKFAFITCSPLAQYSLYKMGFYEVLVIFTGIFEPLIYLYIFLTYVVPCILMGGAYHCLLKRRIQQKYWLKWDPFTWGARALIWQAGDRRWNNKRFGWMTWVVTPWLLMAVVISYSFRGENIDVLNMSPYRWISGPAISLTELYRAGVTMVTDNYRLTLFDRLWVRLDDRLNYYRDFARVVRGNTSIALVTYEDRAEGVMAKMRWTPWESGMCHNGMKARMGKVQHWDARNVVKDWGARSLLQTGEMATGWRLFWWGDDKVIRRIQLVEGPSGLAANMRKFMKEMRVGRGVRWGRRIRFWMRASMRGNMKWLFVSGAIGLGIGLVAWLGERIIWALTPERNKRMRKRKQVKVVGQVVEKVEKEADCDSQNTEETVAEEVDDGLVGGNGLKGSLVEDAIELAEQMQNDLKEAEEVSKAKQENQTRSASNPVGFRESEGQWQADETQEQSHVTEVQADVEDTGCGKTEEEVDESVITEILQESDDEDSLVGAKVDNLELDSEFDNFTTEKGATNNEAESILSSAPMADPIFLEDLDKIHAVGENSVGTDRKI